MTPLPLALHPERPEDAPAVDALHARAFGPGRHARTAYRLREDAQGREAPPAPGLCFVARVGTLVVGGVRQAPVTIGGTPALVLGPLAVEPAFEGRGIGLALLRAALDAARAAGHRLVLLVGDEPYYARTGFRRAPPGRLALPGPVDPARVLVAELEEGALEGVSGDVAPAR